ncbi:hypothetical protein ACEPAF_9905 [Sanghuangporus sanghuang]
MDLYFSRRRFFETSFHAPSGRGEKDGFSDLREIYRVSTTVRRRSIFPDTTTIEHVAPEDEEKHHIVATIWWGWPSQIASIIEIDGKRFMIKDFLKRDPNLLRTGTHLVIGENRFTWRSAVFRPPQLYDSQNRSVAHYIRPVRGLRPVSRAVSVEPGCLHLEPDIAIDTYVRDYVVASFFVYRACRDLRIICTPWWHQEQADFSGIRLRTQDFDKDDDVDDARCW